MNEIGFSYIDNRYIDNLHSLSNFGITGKEKQLKTFFALINSKLDKNLKLYQNQKCSKSTILDIFLKKIENNLYSNFVENKKTAKPLKILVKESKIINQFLKRLPTPKACFLTKNVNLTNLKLTETNHLLTKLISLIFDGEKITLKLKSNELFMDFVYNRVRLKNLDKDVIQSRKSIEIKERDSSILLLPHWKKVNELSSIKDDISDAFLEIKSDNYEQVYLVYPKNREFQKHINLTNSSIEKEHKLKIIPYSLIKNSIKG